MLQVLCRPSDDAGLIAPSCSSTAAIVTSDRCCICTTQYFKSRKYSHVAYCLNTLQLASHVLLTVLLHLPPQYPSLSLSPSLRVSLSFSLSISLSLSHSIKLTESISVPGTLSLSLYVSIPVPVPVPVPFPVPAPLPFLSLCCCAVPPSSSLSLSPPPHGWVQKGISRFGPTTQTLDCYYHVIAAMIEHYSSKS